MRGGGFSSNDEWLNMQPPIENCLQHRACKRTICNQLSNLISCDRAQPATPHIGQLTPPQHVSHITQRALKHHRRLMKRDPAAISATRITTRATCR